MERWRLALFGGQGRKYAIALGVLVAAVAVWVIVGAFLYAQGDGSSAEERRRAREFILRRPDPELVCRSIRNISPAEAHDILGFPSDSGDNHRFEEIIQDECAKMFD
jgi:hypothetical protein